MFISAVFNMYALAETRIVCDVTTTSPFLSCQVYIQSIIHISKRIYFSFICLHTLLAAVIHYKSSQKKANHGSVIFPATVFYKLQIVQNAAARVLTRSRKYDHITPILQTLHWLPIKFRISYKILLLAYKALNDLAPAYLTNLLSRYNPTRSLRSQNSGLLVVPRIAKSTKGGRTFSYLAPKLWNSLPDNVRGSDTLSLFKSRLKTHLFSQAFI